MLYKVTTHSGSSKPVTGDYEATVVDADPKFGPHMHLHDPHTRHHIRLAIELWKDFRFEDDPIDDPKESIESETTADGSKKSMESAPSPTPTPKEETDGIHRNEL